MFCSLDIAKPELHGEGDDGTAFPFLLLLMRLSGVLVQWYFPETEKEGRAGSLKAEVSLVYVLGTLLSFRILQSLSIKLGVIHLVGQRPWLWGKSIQDGEVFTFLRDGAYRYMPQTNWK